MNESLSLASERLDALSYLSQIVLRVFEREQGGREGGREGGKEGGTDDQGDFEVEVLFSPGCGEHGEPPEPLREVMRMGLDEFEEIVKMYATHRRKQSTVTW